MILRPVEYWDYAPPFSQRHVMHGPPPWKDVEEYRFNGFRMEQTPEHMRRRYGYWRRREDVTVPSGGVQRWLAEYFEIDLAKIEAEKRQMLEELRSA